MLSRSSLLLLLVTAWCVAAQGEGLERKRGPWFCHGRSCPRFKTVREEAEYSLRCYSRSTWAVSCAVDAYMPDSVLRSTARVLNYVKENDLWGGTPLATFVHLSLDNQRAWAYWNASAAEAEVVRRVPAALPADANWAHRVVCAAYFLPDKYQAEPGANSTNPLVDRRPPRPGRKSHVRIFRAPRFEAYVSGFHGFPTPPRFIFESMRLVHTLRWHAESFDWTSSSLLVYDPPTAVEGRWNEVLIPARRYSDLLTEGEELYGNDDQGAATV